MAVPAAADIGTELFDRITRHGESFWESIYERFMDRDLNRGQVRALVKKGLSESHGNYRRLLVAFRLPATDYQRFMDFLRHHNLKPQTQPDPLKRRDPWGTIS